MAQSPHMLRPLGFGELMDRSLRVWRAHILPLARVMLPYALLSQLVMLLGIWALAPQQEAMRVNPQDVFAGVSLLIGMGGLMSVAFWLAWLGYVAVSRAAYPLFTGSPAPTGVSGLRLHLSATWAYLALWILAPLLCAVALIPAGLIVAVVGVAIMALGPVGSAAGVIVGVIGVLMISATVMVVLLWLSLRCYFAGQVLAIESTSLGTIWRRSGELMSGRIAPGFLGRVAVRASILLTVVSSIVFSVQGIASIPMLALQFAFSDDLSSMSVHAIPLVLRLPAEAFSVAIQALTSPIFALFGMRFYLDQRVRREALDLELALERRAA